MRPHLFVTTYHLAQPQEELKAVRGRLLQDSSPADHEREPASSMRATAVITLTSLWGAIRGCMQLASMYEVTRL